MKRLGIHLPIVSLIALLSACSTSGGEEAAAPDAAEEVSAEITDDVVEEDTLAPPAVRCIRDPALLAERQDCSRDVDCPCGAYCAFGACAHDCLEDADCAGWCDSFGRCRAGDDPSTAGRVKVPEEGWMQIAPTSIHFYDDEARGVIRVSAERRGLKALRAIASEGLLIKCKDELVSECWFGPLMSSHTRKIRVQLADGADAGPWTLDIRSASRVEQVTIRRGETAPPVSAAPGVYQGQIWMERTAVSLLSDVPWELVDSTLDLRGIKLPVALRIYPDGRLLFMDPYGVLAGDGGAAAPWVFRLAADGRFDMMDDGVDLSHQVYLGGVAVDEGGLLETSDTEVSVATHGALRAIGDVISGRMFVRLGGLGLMNYPAFALDERPVLRWGFRLHRVGDLAADETAPDPGGTAPWYNDIDDSFFYVLPWADVAQDCGTLGWAGDASARTRAEHAICFDHGDPASVPFMAYTADLPLTALGDLPCDEPFNPARSAFRFFTNSEDSDGLLSKTMLSECLADLAHGAAPPTETVGGTTLACLGALSGCEAACGDGGSTCCTKGAGPRCVDVPLVHLALGHALDGLELTGWPDLLAWTATDPDALRLAHRIVQQWIELGSFVVREARQAALPLYTDDSVGLEEALSRSIAAWDLVLHPRVLGTLMHLPAELHHAPDYRGDPALAADASEDRTQAVGIPVTMLEGLRTQLGGAAQLTRRARFVAGDAPAILPPPPARRGGLSPRRDDASRGGPARGAALGGPLGRRAAGHARRLAGPPRRGPRAGRRPQPPRHRGRRSAPLHGARYAPGRVGAVQRDLQLPDRRVGQGRGGPGRRGEGRRARIVEHAPRTEAPDGAERGRQGRADRGAAAQLW